jgi:predicted transcriptional regulator
MGKQKIIENETQKRIYNFILEYPGLHLRELSRKLEIPITTLNYHLRNLEKNGLIYIDSGQKYSRIYAAEGVGNMKKRLIKALRQKTSRNIILYIALALNASRAELSKELELSPTAVSKHLKKLVKQGIIEPAPVENGTICTAHENKTIIERTPNGREIIYRLTRSPNTNKHMGKLLDELFTSYETGLVDDTVKLALEYIAIVNPERKLRKIKKKKEYYLNYYEKKLWDIFPHPYHA